MNILIVSEWFSDDMGYAENYLPEAFGKLGHDVHVLTSDLQVYATSPQYKKIYQKKLGKRIVRTGVFLKKNFTLHRNFHQIKLGQINISGIQEKIKKIKPDVVYCFEVNQILTVEIAKLKEKFNFIMCCESRLHNSVIDKSFWGKFKFLIRNIFFKLTNTIDKVDRFYPISPDVLSNIVKHLNVPKSKCRLTSLGVNTNLFKNYHHTLSKSFRNKLNFNNKDIICLYTGRFVDDKGPLILAKAINALQSMGFKNIKGLFVGDGSTSYKNKLKINKGCTVIPFVTQNKLPIIYNSCDIGVWPLQESTSQLDAMACSLPIILNNNLKDISRVKGNGLLFKLNDFEDLAKKILFLQNKRKRISMGKIGRNRIFSKYSWEVLASQRVKDFRAILCQYDSF
jgi:glycosyltransferase involved in cell wall biosynthesis